MKRKLAYFFVACAILALYPACAKQGTTEVNDANLRYWKAWVNTGKAEHPEYLWQKTPLGSYILESEGGEGAPLGSDALVSYLSVYYTISDIDGNIVTSNREEVAKQLGTYSESGYYDPAVWKRGAGSIPPGYDELISIMAPGQRIKAVLPGWLTETSYVVYKTEEEYVKNVSGTPYMLDIQVVSGIFDLDLYQRNQLVTAARRLYGISLSEADTVSTGLYYIQLAEPTDTTAFTSGVTVQVDYVGRFHTGRCFDTSVKDTAKVYHLYNSSSTYSPLSVNWGDDASSITVGDQQTSLISGFQRALFKMKTGEKGAALFVSDLGYGGTGSGKVPGYSPLIFEIEVLGKK